MIRIWLSCTQTNKQTPWSWLVLMLHVRFERRHLFQPAGQRNLGSSVKRRQCNDQKMRRVHAPADRRTGTQSIANDFYWERGPTTTTQQQQQGRREKKQGPKAPEGWLPVDGRWWRWPAARATASHLRPRHRCSSTGAEAATPTPAAKKAVEVIALVRGMLLATLSCEEGQGVAAAAAWPRR